MKKLKRPLAGIVASAMLTMPVSNVLAAQTTGVYDGCTYTVSATNGTFSGSGYGRYADSSKGLSLTVTFTARDANGVWQTKTASKGGTTYVSATTERYLILIRLQRVRRRLFDLQGQHFQQENSNEGQHTE